MEPRNDEVIAVFRNGKVEDIYAPGRRARAVWKKYKPGSLTYARVLRSDIGFESSVPSVAVADGWLLPEVRVTTFVALSSHDDYAALWERLAHRGLGFMAALSAELDAEMDRFVRGLVAPCTHDEMVNQPRPDKWGAGATLLDGLFVVDRVHVNAAVRDPLYEQKRVAEQRVLVDQAEDARVLAQAERRGLTLDEWENPDRYQQTHELTKLNMQATLELEKLKIDAQRVQVEARRAEIEAERDIKVNLIGNIDRVKRAGLGAEFTRLSPPPGLDAAPEPVNVASEQVTGIPAPIDELARDPQLLGAWRRAGGPPRAVKGIARVADDLASLVVLVLDPDGPPITDQDVLLGEAFPEDATFVFPDAATLEDWIGALVLSRVPQVAQMEATWVLEQVDYRLSIHVGSRQGRAGGIVKAVLREGALVIPALEALLPYDGVSCGTAVM